jgi:hypothetical protein
MKMISHCLTRRQLLAGSVAATVSSGAANSRARAEAVPKPTVGIATFQFGTYSNAELARELAGEGVQTVQLFLSQTDSNYWRYNGRSDLSDLTPGRCRKIADTYRSAGIAIHSLGVYTNLIHPDPSRTRSQLWLTSNR